MYADAVRQDLRCLGIMLVQLIYRRLLTSFELEKYSNLKLFTIADLKSIVSLNKYPEPVRKLLEVCFAVKEEDDFRTGRRFGSKVLMVSLSFQRELRKILGKLRVLVQQLFRDESDEKKPAYWYVFVQASLSYPLRVVFVLHRTEEDENKRIQYVPILVL